MSTRHLSIVPSTRQRTVPSNLIVLPLESTIPPEMTLHDWRHRNVVSIAEWRSRRRVFSRPAPGAA